MVPAVIVIDDFLRNADAVRAEALSLDYAVTGRFPGLNSIQKINLPDLDKAVSAIVRQPVRGLWGKDNSHGSCRVALESDNVTPSRIHVDESHLSGILYLSRDEDCRGGTEFFRHLPTRTDRVPMNPAELTPLGYQSYKDLQRDILDKDAFDRSKWELTMTVPMRFNRLVLLQPHYWHTSGPGFGGSIENGRLIYLMFFKVAPQADRVNPSMR